MKAQIECNFAKINAQPAGKTSYILESYGNFYVRTTLSRKLQFGFEKMTDDTRLAFGDDTSAGVYFMHEGECTEGEFMEIVYDQVD